MTDGLLSVLEVAPFFPVKTHHIQPSPPSLFQFELLVIHSGWKLFKVFIQSVLLSLLVGKDSPFPWVFNALSLFTLVFFSALVFLVLSRYHITDVFIHFCFAQCDLCIHTEVAMYLYFL